MLHSGDVGAPAITRLAKVVRYTVNRGWFLIFAILFFFPSPPAQALALKDVQTFAFVGGSDATPPGFAAAVAGSPSQLVMTGDFGLRPGSQYHRDNIEPSHNRLVFGSIDVTESSAHWEPDAYANGARPSYTANPMGYYDLYTVRYWTPEWKAVLHQEIDAVIANGYDGIFMDVLYGDMYWTTSNQWGNTPNPNATSDLASLVADLIAYVKNKQLGRPFYIIGSDPRTLAELYPSSIQGLDAILLDSLYYNLNEKGKYLGSGGIGPNLYEAKVSTYNKLGIPIFGTDYPPPGDQNANLAAFKYYSAKGWLPTINPETADHNVLTTGPFMFMAVPSNTNVVGANGFINFLSGGLTTSATLTGADKGDYFIGGSGANVINGGGGDDTIYPHPETAAQKNLLKIVVQGDVNNVPSPTLSIAINGTTVVSGTTVTGTFQNGQRQTIAIDTTLYEPVTEIKFTANVANYVNSTTYANIQFQSLEYQQQTLSFSKAAFGSTSSALDSGARAIMNPGQNAITFGSSVLPTAPTFGNTADTIDGGTGNNTVIYNYPYSNYILTQQSNGSFRVTSRTTAEGPDTLRNIQTVKFSDSTVVLPSARLGTQGAVFSSAQSDSRSFLRFMNTGTTSGTVTVTLSDYKTGQAFGTWTSASIAPNAALQYGINDIEAGTNASFTKPDYYSVAVQSNITGYMQHVLWHPSDGTLTNLSTCASGVTTAADRLNSVHTSTLDYGYPSAIAVNNTGSATQTVTLGIYGAGDGAKLGTYTTAAIPAGGQLILSMASLETAANIKPGSAGSHYDIKAEGTFTGFLQHLVNNIQAKVITDMTTVCALNPIATHAGTALRNGAVFSTAQPDSRSFLRFVNTGTTAGTVTVTLSDYKTGQTLGTWTSPSIAPNAAPQYGINEIEAGTNASFTRPDYYSVAVRSNITGYMQHVLWHPSDGTLTNLSTCASGVTAPPDRLNSVHTSTLDSGYPSSIVVNNTGTANETVTLGIYGATDGTKLGTYTTSSIPSGGQTILSMATLETAANIKPGSAGSHYNIRAEGSFTGFLQHLVNNIQAKVITDMTTVCALPAG